ncbi:hypothetical protein FB45DRAFT_906483 [Roridomyces roridus]|uniref:Uncharacterized protein n=1 Tax=Roridomyces roridus TaxID=1738132 RepID=A0AAD7FT93_9AGAR|nr:hypothetical protein FB45DRAFT_906483 [Roridomyces roridus]
MALGLLSMSSCSINLFPGAIVDCTHPVFSGITHLEMCDSAPTTNVLAALQSMPGLTHVAFNASMVRFSMHLTMVVEFLSVRTSVRVVVLLSVNRLEPPASVPKEVMREPRIVWMTCAHYIKDWHQGTLTGEDYWVRAESFVSKRKSGEIEDPLLCWIEGDASEFLP